MLDHLDDIPWNRLTHAHGPAEDVPDFAASPENRAARADGRTITSLVPVWQHLAPGHCLRGDGLCGPVLNRIGCMPAGAGPPRHTRTVSCDCNRKLVPGRARKL